MAKKKAKSEELVAQEAVNFRVLSPECCGSCRHLGNVGGVLNVCYEVDGVQYTNGSAQMALRVCDLYERAPGT